MAVDGSHRYAAFISYSRTSDARLASSLEEALERFAKPWNRLRALRVFRDDADLSASPSLWSSITAVLDDAEYFILLASPAAAQSKWVAREIEYWRNHRDVSRLLLVPTEGDLVWDEAAGDFDWGRTTAVPEALRGAFAEEPRYTDLRWARDRDALTLDDDGFREAVADLASALHGRPKDEMIGEQVRQHRRTIRLARAAVAVLAALALAATIAAVFAFVQREEAITQAEIATSRELAASALGELEGDPELGVLLAREALKQARTEAAERALRQSVGAANVRIVARHGGRVRAAAFDATGGRLVSGGADGTVRVSETATGRTLATLGHGGIVYDAAFSDDGTLVATTGHDRAARVWKLGRAEPLAILRHPDLVWSGEFSHDRRRLLTAGEDGIVRVWDWATGRTLASLRHADSVAEAHFDVTAAHVVTASWDGAARVWDWRHEVVLAELAHPARGPVTSAAFGADGTLVAAATESSFARIVQVWDWSEERLLATLVGHDDLVESVAFSPDGERLATASWDETVRVWDWRAERAVAELRGHGSEVHDATFGPDGRSVATAGTDGTVRLWRLDLRLPIADLEAHQGFAWDGSFDGDGQLVLTAGEDGTARVWDWRAGREVAELSGHGGDVYAAAFSRDGRRVATVAADGTARVWDLRAEERRATLRVRGSLQDVAFSPDGKRVAMTSWQSPWRGTAVVWDWRTERRWDRDIRSGLSAAAFHPGDSGRSLLAVAGRDAAIRLWDWRRDRVAGTLRGHTGLVAALEFSGDGRYLLSAGEDGTARVWDWDANREVAELRAGDAVESAAFDASAALVATAEEGGRVRVWTWRRGTSFLELYGASDFVEAVDFSPDGRFLVTTSDDGHALVHRCDVCGPLEDVEQLASRRVQRALTPRERARFLHDQ